MNGLLALCTALASGPLIPWQQVQHLRESPKGGRFYDISENRKQQFDFYPHGTTVCRFAPYYSLRSGFWSAFLWNGKWPWFFSRMLWMLCFISLSCLCLHPNVHRPSFLGTVLNSAWVPKPFREKTQHSQIPREWDRQAMLVRWRKAFGEQKAHWLFNQRSTDHYHVLLVWCCMPHPFPCKEPRE